MLVISKLIYLAGNNTEFPNQVIENLELINQSLNRFDWNLFVTPLISISLVFLTIKLERKNHIKNNQDVINMKVLSDLHDYLTSINQFIFLNFPYKSNLVNNARNELKQFLDTFSIDDYATSSFKPRITDNLTKSNFEIAEGIIGEYVNQFSDIQYQLRCFKNQSGFNTDLIKTLSKFESDISDYQNQLFKLRKYLNCILSVLNNVSQNRFTLQDLTVILGLFPTNMGETKVYSESYHKLYKFTDINTYKKQ